MARTINLSQEENVTIVTREEEIVTTDKISVDNVNDDGQSVTAMVSFFNSMGYTKTLILWNGQEYINIGQWTDSDVDARIKQLLNLQ
jgi:hypothetical protein